jgi:signal transduction histidine kinase
MQERRPILYSEFGPALWRRKAQDEEHFKIIEQLQPRSLIAMPLLQAGEVRGVMTVATSAPQDALDEEDVWMAQELARRASSAIENARLYRSAQEAVRLRDEFLSVASHELKTPLTPLSIRLQALERDLAQQIDSPFVQKVQAYIETGRRQIQRLNELVVDLLDVSRIEAGRMSLDLEIVNLSELVQEVCSRFRDEAARCGSLLRLQVEASVTGRWDRLRLEQVLMNLLDNGLKYGPGKAVEVSLSLVPGGARLTVTDHGIGIAPENLLRIFGRFERAVSDRNYGGLGLGLYISKTIVEAMGGGIRADSERGVATTFTVELPLNTNVQPVTSSGTVSLGEAPNRESAGTGSN